MRVEHATTSSRLQQLLRIHENNVSELNRGNRQLQITNNAIENNIQTLSRPFAVIEPEQNKLIETLVIYYSDDNEYVYACRQQRSIASFESRHNPDDLIAKFENINNAKYFISFLESNGIIVDRHRRTFKLIDNLPRERFKRKLLKLFNNFITRSSEENIRELEDIVDDSTELQISTEENTL